eukprot:scaffold199677_cov19-Tisochrysis_lutea.AAC.2
MRPCVHHPPQAALAQKGAHRAPAHSSAGSPPAASTYAVKVIADGSHDVGCFVSILLGQVTQQLDPAQVWGGELGQRLGIEASKHHPTIHL